jgi:hypothetical protein
MGTTGELNRVCMRVMAICEEKVSAIGRESRDSGIHMAFQSRGRNKKRYLERIPSGRPHTPEQGLWGLHSLDSGVTANLSVRLSSLPQQ